MKQVSTVQLFGLPVSRMDMEETLRYAIDAVLSGETHHVITVNPIMLMEARHSSEFYQTMSSADLLVPDGTGVVWAAQYIKQPVKERVPGIDLFHRLLALAVENDWRVYLLGAAPDVVQTAVDRLHAQYKGLAIVGYRDGYFPPEEDEDVISQIREAQPHLLFVARSAETQEPWLARYREQLQVPYMMGVGGSYDIIAGRLKRAPLLWQKLRLEWLYRLLQEPSRFRRMLVLPRFVWEVLQDRGKGK